MVEITLKVDGMMCGMCESHVNDAIRKAVLVKKVTSSHVKNQTVVVAADDVDQNAVVKAVTEQGYRVTDISVKPYKKRGLFG